MWAFAIWDRTRRRLFAARDRAGKKPFYYVRGSDECFYFASEIKAIFGDDFDPTNYRLLIFGSVMVAIMVLRPRGFVSTRQPSVHLKERRAVSGELVGEGHG